MLPELKGESFRGLQCIQFDISVYSWPVELPWTEALQVADLRNHRLLKHRVVGKGDEILPIIHQEPEAKRGNIGDRMERG